FLFCFFGKDGTSQQHLTKTWSISTGVTFNAKGGNATLHYHLNSFDEFRLNFYGIKHKYFFPPDNGELSLKAKNLSLEFSKGYKFRHIKKATTNLGMGFFWGKETIEDNLLPTNNLFGISTFIEYEYAPLNWMTLFTRFKMLIPIHLARSKTLRLTFGSRFYF
ncbi:MAG: hypothetical protein AB8G86_03305, partial [Saprospiraceae bacterium]